jgi:pimeloyl-ACP methyl ester carboxylesterase
LPTSSPSPSAPALIERSVGLVGPAGTLVNAKVVDTQVGQRTLVFLHGLVGLNDHWEGVVNLVKQRYRCVMLEIPLLQLRNEDCSIDGVASLTVRFLKDYVKCPATLIGNSFGGHVALRIALSNPELVDSLVLAGSSGIIEKSMVSDLMLRPSREWLARKIGELFYDPDEHMNQADLDRAHRELSDRACARAMVRLSRTARRNHLGQQMTKVTAPTLLLWGKQDIVTPPEAAERFEKMLPNPRLVWIDRCGHAPMIEKPREFARALIDFVDSLENPEDDA